MALQIEDRAITAIDNAPVRASKIPGLLQFPLLVVLSLTLSSLLYSFTAEYTSGDLASVSRRLDEWWEVGALVGWRTFELGLGWFGDYDSYDLASLTVLSHGPPLYLLGAFYNIQPATILSSLLIDGLTTYIPFRLLRPLSRAHTASPLTASVNVPNEEIITDYSVQTIVTLLAGSIYSLVLYSGFASRLPLYLVTYFDNIPSIEAAHSASPVSLLPITLLFGLASKSFIFTPAAAATSRVKVVVQRTAAVVFACSVNTFVQTYVTIVGVQIDGAAIYSGIWAAAAGITGIVLGFVAAV